MNAHRALSIPWANMAVVVRGSQQSSRINEDDGKARVSAMDSTATAEE